METIEFYTDALENDAENAAEYYWERAELYFDNKEYLKALADYDKLIELGFEEEILEDECYLTCMDYKNSEETIDVLSAQLEKNPTVEDYTQRAYLYELREQYEKAFADISSAIALDPSNSELHTCRAELCREIEKYDYSKAIEKSPEDYMFYHDRAECYERNGEYEKAESDYNRAVELNASEYPYSARAGFYQNLECYKEALDDYNKAIELCHEYSEPITTIEDLYIGLAGYYHDRAECYQGLGEYEQAIEDYKRTIDFIEKSEIPQEYKDVEIQHIQEHIEDCK